MKKKYRKIGLILWCDNDDHMKALDYIRHNYDNYIYILHDKDTNGSSLHVKSHYHVLLYFPNQKTISSLCNQLKVEENNFYEIKSLNGQLRYLIHYDDEDKYQYNKNDVVGTSYMMTKYRLALNDTYSEVEGVAAIMDFIFSDYCIHLSDILTFVLDNDIYAVYRRNYSMFKDLLLEKLRRD